MNNWNIVRQKVDNVKEPIDQNQNWKWITQTRALRKIIDKAEEWKIPSDDAEKACYSNLTEIIVEANKATDKNDKDRLTVLFKWAKDYKNAKLRVTLRGDQFPIIDVKKVIRDDGTHYILDLTKIQYDNMDRILRSRFRQQFSEEGQTAE
jgi:hypothetical protein